MKSVFLAVQEKLGEVLGLQYIDKNWGQLLIEQPPVKFPCALLDISSVDYQQLGGLGQFAEGVLEITVCNYRMASSSARSAKKDEAYLVFDVIEAIHQKLQGWSNGEFQPLIRVGIRKLEAGASYEIYKVSFQTGWRVLKEDRMVELGVVPEVVLVQHD